MLALRDMQEIAVVCKRFNWITTNLMKSPRHRYANQYLRRKLEQCQPLWRTENFLREYGASVTFAVLADHKRSVVLGMIAKYCPNIEDLECVIKNQAALDELRPIFRRLRRLRSHITFSVDLNTVFIDDSQSALEILILLSSWSQETKFPMGNLPRLVTFEYCYYPMEERYRSLIIAFVARNPQLKTLILNNPSELLIQDLEYFLEILPSLQTLRFTAGYRVIQDNFLSLTRKDDGLRLYVGRREVSEMQSILGVLQRMQAPLNEYITSPSLTDTDNREQFMEYARAICEHKTITLLVVIGFNDDELLLFAQNLGDLATIYNYNSSSRLTLKGIRRFLETATALKTANFTGAVFTGDDEDIANIITIDNMIRDRGIELWVLSNIDHYYAHIVSKICYEV